MSNIYLGLDGLPVSNSHKERLQTLLHKYSKTIGANECLLCTTTWRLYDRESLVRIKLIADGETLLFAESESTDKRAALYKTLMHLQLQIEEHLVRNTSFDSAISGC